MAWNGSAGVSTPKTPPKKAVKVSVVHGAVALLLVLLAVVALCFCERGSTAVPANSDESSKASTIAESVPSIPAVVQQAEMTAERTEKEDHDKLTLEELKQLPFWSYNDKDCARIDPTYSNRLVRFKKEQAAIPWQTNVDRELAMLLFAKNGNTGMLIPFDAHFRDRFIASLKTPTLVLKTDTDEIKEQKKLLNEVKADLKEELDKGGDIVKILNDEFNELKRISGLQATLRRELREYAKTADSYEDVSDFMDAANIMLKNAGGGELVMPMDLKLKFRTINKE